MRYRVFMMLVANSVVAPSAPALAKATLSVPPRRARALQVEPRRIHVEPGLLPFVADVSVIRACVFPPSQRIAVHMELYTEHDPGSAYGHLLHVRAQTLWPVARIRTAVGMTQVSVVADKRGRVKTEYRTEALAADQLLAGQHGVVVERTEVTARGTELHGRAWRLHGGSRAFSALVRRDDVGYTFDLGRLGDSWLRLDVRGDKLTGLSALSVG